MVHGKVVKNMCKAVAKGLRQGANPLGKARLRNSLVAQWDFDELSSDDCNVKLGPDTPTYDGYILRLCPPVDPDKKPCKVHRLRDIEIYNTIDMHVGERFGVRDTRTDTLINGAEVVVRNTKDGRSKVLLRMPPGHLMENDMLAEGKREIVSNYWLPRKINKGDEL